MVAPTGRLAGKRGVAGHHPAATTKVSEGGQEHVGLEKIADVEETAVKGPLVTKAEELMLAIASARRSAS